MRATTRLARILDIEYTCIVDAGFETLREALRDEEGSVDKVIRALKYLTTKYPHRAKIRQGLGYFVAIRPDKPQRSASR